MGFHEGTITIRSNEELQTFFGYLDRQCDLLERIVTALEHPGMGAVPAVKIGFIEPPPKECENPDDDYVKKIVADTKSSDRWGMFKSIFCRRFPERKSSLDLSRLPYVCRTDMINLFKIFLEAEYSETFVKVLPDQMVVEILECLLN